MKEERRSGALRVEVVSLSFQRYFYGADVSQRSALFSRRKLIRPDADSLDFYVRQKSAPNDFGDINCQAYGFSTCFDAYLFCSAMKAGYAGKHVVHHWFFPDQHR